MKGKNDEKKGAETAAEETAPGAAEGTGSDSGTPDKNPTEKPGETKSTVRVRFVNTYTGAKGCFYAGKEYDLTPELYDLFKADCEKKKG